MTPAMATRSGVPQVVTLSDEIDICNAGSAARELRSAFRPAVAVVIADLTQTSFADSSAYASPIVARGLTIVATEQDTVYAFDQSHRQVWKRRLGSPSPAQERQCGDIDPLI